MGSLNNIQIIHATDAEQHLGHLKKILDTLKSENRIKGYSTLESEAVNESSLTSLVDGDMVITLLTNGITADKALVEEIMLKAKASLPGAKMAEIIIDHVPYENQFIAFPSDLEPIRSREDMDGVWNKIGQTLKEIFPPHEEPIPPVPLPWKKYLPYVLGALALLLLFWLIPSISNEDEMQVVSVETSVSTIESDSDECPKQFDFQGTIKVNAPGKVVYTWVRSDKQPSSVDTLEFEAAGEQQVSSSWTLGSEAKKYEEWQQLKIISPNRMVSNEAPIAFECGGSIPLLPTGDKMITSISARTEISGDPKVVVECGKRHEFEFKGTITANGKGEVNFVWVGNDGITSPTQTLVFEKAGSKTVTNEKEMVADVENGYEGWQQLKVVGPVESYSEVAKYVLYCEMKVVPATSGIKADFTNLGSSKIINSDYFKKLGIRSVKTKPSGNYCDVAVPAIHAKGTSRSPVSYLTTAIPNKLNSCNTIILEFVFNEPVAQVTVYFYGAAVDNRLTAYRSNGRAIGYRTKKAVTYNYTRPYSVTYKSSSKDISQITFGYQSARTMITGIQGK